MPAPPEDLKTYCVHYIDWDAVNLVGNNLLFATWTEAVNSALALGPQYTILLFKNADGFRFGEIPLAAQVLGSQSVGGIRTLTPLGMQEGPPGLWWLGLPVPAA